MNLGRTIEKRQALLVLKCADVLVQARHQKVDGKFLTQEYLEGGGEFPHLAGVGHLVDANQQTLPLLLEAQEHLLECGFDFRDGRRRS